MFNANVKMTSHIQIVSEIIFQKFFRGRKVVQAARLDVRDRFYRNFGLGCEKVDRYDH